MKVKSAAIEMLLADRGLTKKDLAKESGIAASNISTIVRRGTCEPKTAAKLARGLGVKIEDIMESEG